jgi:hypothetical protein
LAGAQFCEILRELPSKGGLGPSKRGQKQAKKGFRPNVRYRRSLPSFPLVSVRKIPRKYQPIPYRNTELGYNSSDTGVHPPCCLVVGDVYQPHCLFGDVTMHTLVGISKGTGGSRVFASNPAPVFGTTHKLFLSHCYVSCNFLQHCIKTSLGPVTDLIAARDRRRRTQPAT